MKASKLENPLRTRKTGRACGSHTFLNLNSDSGKRSKSSGSQQASEIEIKTERSIRNLEGGKKRQREAPSIPSEDTHEDIRLRREGDVDSSLILRN